MAEFTTGLDWHTLFSVWRTVQQGGWDGLKNGELLCVDAAEGFEILVTEVWLVRSTGSVSVKSGFL